MKGWFESSCHRYGPSRVFLALALLSLPAAPAWADGPAGWDKPMRGLVVSLPTGWKSEYDPKEPQSLDLTCETDACRDTQETCQIIVTDEPIPFPDFVPSGWMVALTIGGPDIRQDVLDGSHEGTTVTREPGSVWIGGRSWYAAETLAPYGWKSMLHATAVMNERFVRVRCWTCDRSEQRFAFAHQILSRIKIGS